MRWGRNRDHKCSLQNRRSLPSHPAIESVGDPEARRAAGRRPKAEGGGRGGAKSCPQSRSQEIRWEPSGERRWPKPRAGEAIPNQGKREVEGGFLGQTIGAIQSSQRPNLALSFLKEIHQSTSGAFALAGKRVEPTLRSERRILSSRLRSDGRQLAPVLTGYMSLPGVEETARLIAQAQVPSLWEHLL